MEALLDQPLPPRVELTDEQRRLISSSAPVLVPDVLGTKITKHMYDHMLAANPDLKNIFSHSKQATGKQAFALASSVHAYATHINNLTPILPVVERIAHKHASLHITPQMYGIVAKYLMAALDDVLGAAFTPELRDAWAAGYWALAYIFIDKERELYEAAGWVGWRDFIVEKRVKESSDITSFYLRPKDGKPLRAYKPGQYISVQLTVEELGSKQSRQYSLSDSPTPDHYRISVKREPGVTATTPSGEVEPTSAWHPAFISNLLHDKVYEGSVVEVAYPFGEVVLDTSNPTAPVVLLSAGIGLTPALSMLNTLVNKGVSVQERRPVTWIQGIRSPTDHPFLAHVKAAAQAYPDQLRTAYFYSKPGDATLAKGEYEGRVNLAQFIETEKLDGNESPLYLGNSQAHYYTCGPVLFMADMRETLKKLGISEGRIHEEVFAA